MSVSASVLVALGAGLAKWLAKRYLGDLSQDLVGELIDFGKEKIPDVIERRNAARQFERYADDILKRMLQSLETRRKRHPELDDDAVARELMVTFLGYEAPNGPYASPIRFIPTRITEHFLIAKDLDPRIVAADLRQQRPLPAGKLPELETRVYEQVLDEVVRYLIEVASLLPSFQPAVAAESLKRLSNLGQDVSDVLNTVQRLEACAVGTPDDLQFAKQFDEMVAISGENAVTVAPLELIQSQQPAIPSGTLFEFHLLVVRLQRNLITHS